MKIVIAKTKKSSKTIVFVRSLFFLCYGKLNSPHRFYFETGKAWVSSSEFEFYTYQTQMGLPSNWSTYYDAIKGRMSVDIKGNVLKESRSMCGKAPLNPKQDNIVFEKPEGIKADADLH